MFKHPHVTLDPEDINPTCFYAFSINPEQNYDDMKNSNYLKRDECTTEYLIKWFTHGLTNFDYILFPEVKNGRIHFHGYIKIINPLDFELFVLPIWKSISTYCIKKIDDEKVWFDYCTKQRKLWKEKKYPLIKRNIKISEIIPKGNTGEAEKN